MAGEVAQNILLVRDAVARYILSLSPDLPDDLDDVIEVTLGVNPARKGEAYELER